MRYKTIIKPLSALAIPAFLIGTSSVYAVGAISSKDSFANENATTPESSEENSAGASSSEGEVITKNTEELIIETISGEGASEEIESEAGEADLPDAPNLSFDCSGELTPHGKMVCENAELSELDAYVNEKYLEWKLASENEDATLQQEAFKIFEEDHARWLGLRDSCPADSLNCLIDAYNTRYFELVSGNGVFMVKDDEIALGGTPYKVFTNVYPSASNASYIPHKMLASTSFAVQTEILKVLARKVIIDGCVNELPCEQIYTFDYSEFSPELISIQVFYREFNGGAHGFSSRYSIWIDRQKDKRLNFSDLFDPKNLDAVQSLLSHSVLSEVEKVYAESDINHEGDNVLSSLNERSLASWNYSHIYPIISDDGKIHKFGVTGDDYEYGAYAFGEYFQNMSIEVEPFLPLMKPEYRQVFEK